MKTVALLSLLAVFLGFANADVYLNRGSNNRLKGTNRNRDNANRIFDSQNNARGGYNVGSQYFYQGSILPIEWTSQHSCGSSNNRCEIILQYMCDDRLRDGTNEKTIPDANGACYNNDCDTDPRYGRQESYLYYKQCATRARNKGIFYADQNVGNRNVATYTRQNNQATRYGYECAEERDYYPYWGPTPWRDIAVLTNDPTRCEAYKTQSQNVKSRFYCSLPDDYYINAPVNNAQYAVPITSTECNEFTKTLQIAGVDVEFKGTWTEVPSFNTTAPVCRQNMWQRDNHLGNTVGGQPVSFNWTLPIDQAHERCAYRIRYNITSDDFPGFASFTSTEAGDINSSLNGNNKLNIAQKWADNNIITGMDLETAKGRGYTLQNNPDVDIFGEKAPKMPKLQLNINTAQFSRTFEDRSHRFAIRKRDGIVPDDALIHNIYVRGKRGNVVQNFPATEYDYVPSKLTISLGDYVHFQWTGSKRNPNNNAGNGAAGTDATNIVGIMPKPFVESSARDERLPTEGALGANIPKKVQEGKLNFLGFDSHTLTMLATNGVTQFGGDMDQLNDAGTYFDLGPKQVGSLGIFNYLCTRNNDFSNRSQKGTIVVDRARTNSTVVGWNGETLVAASASAIIEEGAFTTAQEIGLSSGPAFIYGLDEDTFDMKSDIVTLSTTSTEDGSLAGPVKLVIKHSASPIAKTKIYYASDIHGEWTALDTDVGSSDASVMATKAGSYVVRAPVSGWIIALIIVAVAVLLILAAGLIIYCRKLAVSSSYQRAGIEINN